MCSEITHACSVCGQMSLKSAPLRLKSGVGMFFAICHVSAMKPDKQRKANDMKKILIPVAMVIVAAVAYAGANGETCACAHHHSEKLQYGNSNAYKRFCQKHGWYDIRFGFTCPGCKAPKFGF